MQTESIITLQSHPKSSMLARLGLPIRPQ